MNENIQRIRLPNRWAFRLQLRNPDCRAHEKRYNNSPHPAQGVDSTRFPVHMRRETSGWIDALSIGDGVPNITARYRSATGLETCITCASRTQYIARPQPSCLPGVNSSAVRPRD